MKGYPCVFKFPEYGNLWRCGDPNPKGMCALLNKTSDILKIDIDDSGIQSEGQQFELKINKAMENSQDLAEYVSKLEEADVSIEDNFSEDNLVQQIEDFLNEEREI